MERPPRVARELLGARADDLVPYAGWLAGAGIERGLLGPREAARLWDRHLLNCAAAADALPVAGSVIDVGSGAGLPGLVWAIVRPDLAVTVVEPLLRRSAFLVEVVAGLGLGNVEVLRARAQDVASDLHADVVASRAVAPLTRLGEWCLPLVAPGGSMWAIKGQAAAAELASALPALQRAGAGDAHVSSYGEGILEQPARVVHVGLAAH